MERAKKIVALIVAAGSGSRAGGEMPKQYRSVAGKPMLRHSFETFSEHEKIDDVIVVIAPEHRDLAISALAELPKALLVNGGATRRESVRRGLQAIAASGGADAVLIHDAARPNLTSETIDQLLLALNTHKGAVPALAVVDSLARGGDRMQASVDRNGLWRIQTPQAFHFDTILAAHLGWDEAIEATDDACMMIAAGGDVALVAGDERLTKFTFAEDFEAENHGMKAMTQIRTGTGFDVHRLVIGEELWLCGVKVDYPLGLSGHSDADVALHALTDAILGALALGDIGEHFPSIDAQWRGASSGQFLQHAVKCAADKGYALGNADITIICEAPKIGAYRAAMRAQIAQIIGVDIDQISVKATTTERLGFTGRGEGIAAQAIATMVKEA
jgi:2-C-methyl-D-erythritol 4-phosphate cytidylyltransferase / 2-C-methyl-D-erythritol 2,4-cyclodiphosphate synthase